MDPTPSPPRIRDFFFFILLLLFFNFNFSKVQVRGGEGVRAKKKKFSKVVQGPEGAAGQATSPKIFTFPTRPSGGGALKKTFFFFFFLGPPGRATSPIHHLRSAPPPLRSTSALLHSTMLSYHTQQAIHTFPICSWLHPIYANFHLVFLCSSLLSSCKLVERRAVCLLSLARCARAIPFCSIFSCSAALLASQFRPRTPLLTVQQLLLIVQQLAPVACHI